MCSNIWEIPSGNPWRECYYQNHLPHLPPSIELTPFPNHPSQYIDPNYAGGEYDEYYGDDAPGSLDCHSPDSEWELIGVYRQEFYQYIEQISKHLW